MHRDPTGRTSVRVAKGDQVAKAKMVWGVSAV